MYANGGIAAVAQRMQRLGRDGDTILAHITPQEAQLLMETGGRGTVNPSTGLPEFAQEDTFDADLYAARNADVVAAYGNDPAALFQHYQDHGRSEGRVGNQREIEAREQGYAGEFGGGGYQQFAQDDDQIQDLVGRAYAGTTHGGGAIADPKRRIALNAALAGQFGYGGDFGQGGFGAFNRVQTPEKQSLIRSFIDNFKQPSPTAPNNNQPAQPTSLFPQATPADGGIAGLTENIGQSLSPVTTGDVFTAVDYDASKVDPRNVDQILAEQGVGVRYYILTTDANGNIVKRFVSGDTPGAVAQVTGVYGTTGGVHDFFPNELGGLPDELDVDEILGIDKDKT